MSLPRSLLALLVACLACYARAASTSITYPAQPGPGAGKHLVFLSGDEEYRGEEGLPMLAKILSQRHGFKCTVLFPLDPDGTINPDNNASIPGIEALDTADGIVMQLRFRQWPDAAMKHFADAVARGIPIVALRTSTHAFRFPGTSSSAYMAYNNFGREVLGENWVSHWGANRKGALRPRPTGRRSRRARRVERLAEESFLRDRRARPRPGLLRATLRSAAACLRLEAPRRAPRPGTCPHAAPPAESSRRGGETAAAWPVPLVDRCSQWLRPGGGWLVEMSPVTVLDRPVAGGLTTAWTGGLRTNDVVVPPPKGRFSTFQNKER